VPTGRSGAGYDALTADVRGVIDDAIEVIADLVRTGRYARVVYSAGPGKGDLGTGIFRVDEEVRRYIVQRLHGLADLPHH
jgi:hypothetical protein